MRIAKTIFLVLLFSFSAFSQQLKTTAPDFSATTIDGEEFTLQGLRGYVIVLTFWSTTCPICQAEIPNLNTLTQKYKNQEVVFLAVSTENKSKINSFLKKNPFDFVMVPDGFGVLFKYADKDIRGNLNMGFPAHFIINPRGEIETKTSGWEKTAVLESKINSLLSPPVASTGTKAE